MTTVSTPRSDRHRRQRAPLLTFLMHWRVFAVVGLCLLTGALVSPKFLTLDNLVNTILAVGLLGIVAVGVAFVTYSGQYADLSVPAIMAFSGIIAVSSLGQGLAVALLAGIAAGLAIGLVNGVVIGVLRVNPIIWTLAMAAIMDGLIRWLYSGRQVYPDASTSAGAAFVGLYGSDLFGIPTVILILAALVSIGAVIMTRTRYGAELKLLGASYDVARMTGINVRGHVVGAFLLSAVAAAIGGLLLTSLNKVGAAYIGKGYDFLAVTAVVIGGITLAGGRGNILGVLGGVLVIGLMQNILTLLGVGSFTKDIIQGVVFILVVGTQAYSLRKAGRDDA